MKKIVFALIIAAAVLGGTFFLSRPEVNFIEGRSTVSASGSARITLPAEKMSFSVTTSTRVRDCSSLKTGMKFLDDAQDALRELLKAGGIDEKFLTASPVSVHEIRAIVNGKTTNGIDSVIMTRRFSVAAPVLPDSEALPGKISEGMLKKGFFSEVSEISYSLRNPEKLENELIYLASIDAFRRASDIVRASGSRPGKLVSSSSSPLETEVRMFPKPSVSAGVTVTLELETVK